MAQILPRNLPAVPGGTVNVDAAAIVDNGDGVFKATPPQVVDAGAPINSQAEAEAGAVNTGRMSPLRVKQAIEALGVSQDVLASPAGGEMVGFSHDAPNTGDTIGQRLAQEIWVTDAPYNADPTGVADASTAFQNAIDALEALGGGTLRGKGVFKVSGLELPAEPAVVNLRGEGFAATTLVQGTANAPIIKKVSGVSRIVGAQLVDFTVQAHASSVKATATNILIDIHGFDSATIRVGYLSASGATSTTGCAHAVVSGHANNGPCYQNKIYVKLHQGAGPAKGVWLHNGGAGTSLANANCNEVSVWAYGLTNLGAAIDAADTTQTVVKLSIIEDCPGATGVIAGNFTLTRNNWIELVAVSINYGATADTTANNCISIADQFSGTNKIVIHSSIAGPPRFEAPLFGTMTFHNQSAAATTNYVLPTVAKATPAVPTIAWLIFTGNVVAIDASAIRMRPDHHGIVTSMATYTVTPAGTGRDALAITPPAGFEIMNATVGIEEIGVAVRPVALAADTAGKNYVVYWPNTNNHQVNVRVTMRATS